MNLQQKYTNLKNIIKNFKKVAIAFSGGVDSTFLAKVCKDTLDENAIAITIHAAIHSNREIEEAKALAKKIGIKHILLEKDVLELNAFKQNPNNRCYLCKKEIFTQIKEIAKNNGIDYVLDGSNLDDLGDYRPGLKALEELDIKSPLKEAKLKKEEIRILSKQLNLPTWQKPAFACLATRFPYGEMITKEKLKKVEQAENYLMDLGFKQFRVRYHENMARIEVDPEERVKFFDISFMDQVSEKFKSFGFKYVSLDLQGYKMGSMNATIK
ncbi:ATP-dependent sacrificial sulfur transferase LarE [Crassaminicella thermophila]|uniref:ATP-dependent sacrificial sulfur transferase LarE n=1 Tax=Crassaminicella thermophila TaxID=2599308 RepID=A0A5C0SI64_CRATE|nr:ATP-dependent sacrificial sulfur transferase LarE [Crassaminicella thermophila]QEK13367.1 ATP-dependent sacrificial sulfur transferase LarE [Crassaminicella thermophila]